MRRNLEELLFEETCAAQRTSWDNDREAIPRQTPSFSMPQGAQCTPRVDVARTRRPTGRAPQACGFAIALAPALVVANRLLDTLGVAIAHTPSVLLHALGFALALALVVVNLLLHTLDLAIALAPVLVVLGLHLHTLGDLAIALAHARVVATFEVCAPSPSRPSWSSRYRPSCFTLTNLKYNCLARNHNNLHLRSSPFQCASMQTYDSDQPG